MNAPPLPEEKEVILRVVRGERPWTDLGKLGIDVRIEGDRCTIRNPRGIEATADIQDLASGLLAHQGDPRALRSWAFVVEAGSPFLDLDVEGDPAGEILLDALWKAGFGEPIPKQAVQTAERLVANRAGPV
jgi:hypothetical protein